MERKLGGSEGIGLFIMKIVLDSLNLYGNRTQLGMAMVC